MDTSLEEVAAAAGKDPAVIDSLDKMLNGPKDRAFLVCGFGDCGRHFKGHCDIYILNGTAQTKVES